MSRDPFILLDDIAAASLRAITYTANLDRDAFLRSELVSDAVIRCLTVVGEAIKLLPQDFRERHGEVPWRRIVGMRDRIVHDYLGVDLNLVWEVVQSYLPELREQVLRIVRDEQS